MVCRPSCVGGSGVCLAGGEHPVTLAIRKHLRRPGNLLAIPSRPARPVTVVAQVYKQRDAVERCISRLKQWRVLAMRTDKLAIVYRAALCFAAILIRARA